MNDTSKVILWALAAIIAGLILVIVLVNFK
jgi:hypothetical protein